MFNNLFPLVGLLAGGEIIIIAIFLGLLVLFIRTLIDIINFSFRNSDSKFVWVVCLFIFSIPAMILWWTGKKADRQFQTIRNY